MKTFNRNELIKYFGVSESMIKTNFPLFCSKQLAKGYQITKRGKGDSAVYEVEKVEPQIIDKSKFSSRPINSCKDLPNEIWIQTYCSKVYEVSNLGRVRNKINKILLNGFINKNGYVVYSLENKNYLAHRLVLQSFQPIDNFEEMTGDHINGIKTDNSLKNLRWLSAEDNVVMMIFHRKELNKELTRLIQKWGYDETLARLKEM